MTVTELLTHLTRVIFVLLFVVTTIDYLRRRDKIRRDVALVFLCLSANTLVLLIASILNFQASWLTQVGSLALLAQPYLLLRLVGYFRPVPLSLQRAALVGLFLSWVLVLGSGIPLTPASTLTIVAYFVLVDGYAVIAFIKGAFSTVGVVRQRLRFAAAGSGMLLFPLFLAGVRTVSPALSPLIIPFTQLFSVLSSLTYYLGFAPPRWLRQMWQLDELRNYLRQVQQSGETTSARVLDNLDSAVTRAMGTKIAVIALWDKESDKLVLQKTSEVPSLSDFYVEGVIQAAWRDQRAHVVYKSSQLSTGDVQLMTQLDAEALMIVPIATNDLTLGLLLVFLQYGSLFVDDDLDLLTIFAQQTAVHLENQTVLERLLRSNEELELKVQERTSALQRSNEELRQFAYVASHDLQEPLRTVSSYLQLIETRYPDKLDDDGREFIAFAVDGAARMKDLIRDLLTYSRVETQPRKIEVLDVQKVLDAACKLLEVSIKEAEASITNDPLPQIKADQQLMIQLFQNLISNAIKYHGDQKPQIHIGAVRDKGWWTFSVRDNGIGMESKYLERIFIIFQRLHTRSQYPGTGIGLSICKKAVELQGGRIWAESVVGQGTTFYFTLPA
ncbi:MAG: ATP-binding protein [Chloroflexota bacterium]